MSITTHSETDTFLLSSSISQRLSARYCIEEVAEQNAPVDDHDLIDVIEKLTEEVNALKARVVALEEVKEEKVEEKVEAEATCGDDPNKERINNIYRNIMMPQACVSIGAPKAAAQKRVNKVDYKAFKNFIND